MNANNGDIRDALTDSLSRSGKGGMLVPFQNMDGTQAAPGITFTEEPGTGIRRAAANDLRGVVAGVDVLGLLKSGGSYIVQLFRGALRLIDPSGGKAVTVSPPSGLAADYALTLPSGLPASTLPLSVSAAGAMSAGPILNSQQNFGTPSAATDVAIKSYVDGVINGSSTTLTPRAGWLDFNGDLGARRIGNMVFLVGAAQLNVANPPDFTLLTLPVGFRPSAARRLPATFSNSNGFPATYTAASVTVLTDGTVGMGGTNPGPVAGSIYFFSGLCFPL